MFKCSQCKKTKPSTDYGTRKIGSAHGQKGDRLSLCLSCSAINTANNKRKRVNSNPEHPVKRFAAQSATPPIQFVEDLAKLASAPKIDGTWRVSLDEMVLSDKGIANHIASLAWKAVGYRFRYKPTSSAFALRVTAHSDYSTQLPLFKTNCYWAIQTVYI